jgi:putative tryptophan/tyrosine transport system substrate-binding protein
MKRRAFITVLGGAAVAWPLVVRAQQPAMPVVGLLLGGTPDTDSFRVDAIRRGPGNYVHGHRSRNSQADIA